MHVIDEVFAPVLGKPSWSVERGRDSAIFADRPAMVFLEFGDPALTIGEPRDWPVGIDGAPEITSGRLTFVRGHWHLTLTGCTWELTLNDTLLATSESPGELIDRALDVLNGQALLRVEISSDNGATVFVFDLGCVLRTSPRTGVGADDAKEQWVLTQASRTHLAVRSDGRYQLRPVEQSASDHPWNALY